MGQHQDKRNRQAGPGDHSGARSRRNSKGGGPAPQATPGSGPEAFGGGGVVDRRLGLDRRDMPDAEGAEFSDLDRRRGAGRRRSDFLRSADEGELTREQFMFLMAINSFKKANNKLFPTWTDVLEVIRLLGYRKTMPSEFKLTNAEDWREAADAPASVRTIDGKAMRRAA